MLPNSNFLNIYDKYTALNRGLQRHEAWKQNFNIYKVSNNICVCWELSLHIKLFDPLEDWLDISTIYARLLERD